MSVAILHIKKFKGAGSLRGVQIEVDRKEGYELSNPDIDTSRTVKNSTLDRRYKDLDIPAAVQARIAELNLPRAVRKDAVLAFGAMVSAGEDPPSDPIAFLDDARAFLGRFFGEDNIVQVQLHLDETSPHIHCIIVPATPDGRLCAKEVLNPEALQKMQARFYEEVGANHKYDRPKTKAERIEQKIEYKDLKAFKAQNQPRMEELQKELAGKEAAVLAATERAAAAESRTTALQKDYSMLQRKYDRLAQIVEQGLDKAITTCFEFLNRRLAPLLDHLEAISEGIDRDNAPGFLRGLKAFLEPPTGKEFDNLKDDLRQQLKNDILPGVEALSNQAFDAVLASEGFEEVVEGKERALGKDENDHQPEHRSLKDEAAAAKSVSER